MVNGMVPEARCCAICQVPRPSCWILSICPPNAPSPLTFTYAPYTATGLGLTFESVAGYTIDDSTPNTYILTEPSIR